jgi:hypothetical protein
MLFPFVPLSKSVAELSLSMAEFGLVIFAAVLIIGSVGEHKARPRPDPWLPSSIKPPGWRPPGWNWPQIWKWVVIAGIIGELFCDGGVWVSSGTLWAFSNQEIESLRSTNVEMEKALSPRVFDQGAFGASVRQFSDMAFAVISPSEMEPRRTAGQIRWALNYAGWKRYTDPIGRLFGFPDGIVVHPGSNLHALPPISDLENRLNALQRESELSKRREAAAIALVAALVENKVSARVGYPVEGDMVLVEVGLKPVPGEFQVKTGSLPPGPRATQIWGNILE